MRVANPKTPLFAPNRCLRFAAFSLLIATVALSFETRAADPAGSRPNIIFFLADDLGYGDIGCYGCPDAKTPVIDQLAAEGIRFTNAYAMGPECSPSRTAFLTGRYPQRVGGLECAIGTGNVGRYDHAIRLAEANDLGLPADQAVLAPALKQVGYANAVFGKWHMGYEPKFSPLDQGFDAFIGFLGGNVDYFHHQELSDLEVYLDGRNPIEREGYTTHLITDDAIAFVEARSAEPEVPFFLYVAHATPHFPFQAPDSDPTLPTAEEWTQGTRETYVKMLEDLDAEVGRLLEAVDQAGLRDNTLVVFASDHGAMDPGFNAPWRGAKGTLFEGGIRVPLIARWPGKIEPGSESDVPFTLMDLSASFLAAAGAEPEVELDGMDVLGHLLSGRPVPQRTLYWRARRGDRTWWAVNDGRFKYVRNQEGGAEEAWLFDLIDDAEESQDLLMDRAPLAAALNAKLTAWEEKVAPTRGVD